MDRESVSKWSSCKTQWPSVAGLFFQYWKDMGYSPRPTVGKKNEGQVQWVLGVGDSWTDGSQPRIRSQIRRQHWHIPDQILISCQYLHPSYGQSEPPLLVCPIPTSGSSGGELRRPWGSPETEDRQWVRRTDEVGPPGTQWWYCQVLFLYLFALFAGFNSF